MLNTNKNHERKPTMGEKSRSQRAKLAFTELFFIFMSLLWKFLIWARGIVVGHLQIRVSFVVHISLTRPYNLLYNQSSCVILYSMLCHPKFSICLTHWGRVMYICVSELTIIGLDNGLSPGRRQAIIWTNAGILLIWTLWTNFSEIFIEFHTISFKKMLLKRSSAKWRPFCLRVNVLIILVTHTWDKQFSSSILPALMDFTTITADWVFFFY